MPTLTECRRAVAAELGGYALATSIGTAGAGNKIALTAALSTELPETAFAYQWVYLPDHALPNQARIQADGIDNATGVVTLEKTIVSEPPAGQQVELHSLLPAVADSQRPAGELSVNECVNLGLRSVLVQDDGLSLAIEADQQEYVLGTTWAWLNRAERLLDVRQPNARGTAYVSTFRHWEFRESARGSSIRFREPFRGSGTLKLVALRPADTLVSISSVWTDTGGGGLTSNAYVTAVPLADLVPVALAFCYRTLRDNSLGGERDDWDRLYVRQVAEARRVHNFDHSNDAFVDVPKGAGAAAPAAGQEAA